MGLGGQAVFSFDRFSILGPGQWQNSTDMGQARKELHTWDMEDVRIGDSNIGAVVINTHISPLMICFAPRCFENSACSW